MIFLPTDSLQIAQNPSSMYHLLFDRCEHPFLQPEFPPMATLCFAASIFVAVAVDRLLCGRATPPPPPTPPISLSLSDANIEWVLTHCENLERQLVRQQRDYRQLQLVTASSQAKYLQLERRFLSNEEQYERRCAQLESDNARLQDLVDSQNKELRVQPFVYFFDKLLLANKMWKQQKDLAQAKSALVEREQEIRTHAFRNFRDRVLAANLVWKQQTQMKKLREEAERIKKGRVRAVTRSAKQMVLDTRKDGLIEELVKGLDKRCGGREGEGEAVEGEV
ncbi:hypothetical protein BT96DRAFT_675949 [Gymnopus androsaceus JB14]|uniref:Uncharacterized protein n=1 Tax=Gymnopus androsaceus JB14 TaxID=1447944 RepID=A0A6A4HP66_9AGAR|nr:hypothetical protein BT96DRAFT_675949 [Gymnopus androsaceus JB14]